MYVLQILFGISANGMRHTDNVMRFSINLSEVGPLGWFSKERVKIKKEIIKKAYMSNEHKL